MSVRAKLLLIALTTAVLGGCTSATKQEPSVEGSKPAPSVTSAKTQPVTKDPVQETEPQKFGRLIKSVEGLSVYFAYDDFAIKPEYHKTLEAHAEVLKQAGRGTVVVEGNADERGSREYNLALGQKRAQAVANALKTLGISADRIEAVSFGKEKPRALCHEEKCWAENRRVDFTYKLK